MRTVAHLRATGGPPTGTRYAVHRRTPDVRTSTGGAAGAARAADLPLAPTPDGRYRCGVQPAARSTPGPVEVGTVAPPVARAWPTRTRGSRSSTTRSTGRTAATGSTASSTSGPRAVGVVAVAEDGRLLLVGQHRYALDEYSWEIPEGGVAEGESLVDGARRELREETGFDAADWRQLCRLTVSNSVTDERGAIFVASGLRAGTASPEPTEDLAVRWATLDEVLAEIAAGDIHDVHHDRRRRRLRGRSAADDDRGPGPAGVHGCRRAAAATPGRRPRRRRGRRRTGARRSRPSSAISETVFVDDAATGSIRIFTPGGRAGVRRASHRGHGLAPAATSGSADRSCAVRPATSRRGRTATCPGSARGRRGSTRSPAPSCASPAAVDALTGPPPGEGSYYAVGVDRRAGGHAPGALLRAGLGIGEDEATGAAAVMMGGLLGRPLEIRQGVGSVLHVRPGPGRHGRGRRAGRGHRHARGRRRHERRGRPRRPAPPAPARPRSTTARRT